MHDDLVGAAPETSGPGEDILSREGQPDVLVNNAGVAGLAAPVSEYPDDEWRRILAVDLDGVFYCCKAVLPHMLDRGSGRIVNIASIAGKGRQPQHVGLFDGQSRRDRLHQVAGQGGRDAGIFVNCVTPAVIFTDILAQLSDEAVGCMTAKIPMARSGRPDEVAAQVAWLASDECSFTTGALFDISGGRATY